MVPSFTCTAEPEAGDVRMGSPQNAGLGQGWRWEGAMWGPRRLGAGAWGLEQSATEAGGGRKGPTGGDASVTSEKLSRYLKEVYLAQMLGLL